MKNIFFFFLFIAIHAKAQLPETQIYLFDVQKSPKGYSISNPQMISKKAGYNNQPNFSPDGKYLFFVSSVDTSNTEIYKIDLTKKRFKAKQLTKTVEPEYSPRYTPDMSSISCVRVEKDKITQHFYTYNLKGKKPFNILPDLKMIGYYDWISQNEFLSFDLPEPFYLVKHTISSNGKDTLAKNVGRCFYYLRNKSKIVYVDKTDSLHWKIRTIANENLKKNVAKKVENPVLTETLPNEEDYCFFMDGSILMGHDGILYMKKNPFKNMNSTWDELVDFKKMGIDKFYRIVTNVENTKIAIVVFRGKKP